VLQNPHQWKEAQLSLSKLQSEIGGSTHRRRVPECGRVALNEERYISNDQEIDMTMTAEQREQVATELKRFAADIDLSEEQKEKLGVALVEGRERVGAYMKAHPNTTKAEIVAKVKEHRGEIHDRVAGFLNPEQLDKWDKEVAKSKEFLGQRLDS
jgi:hypothetical protein